MTVTSIGYGDITPTTDGERNFTIVALLFGALLFAYIVGKGSTIPDDETFCDCWHSSIHSEVPANREYAMPCNLLVDVDPFHK